ncbi:MAG: hypothetical protein FWD90_10185 [Defluviitaleaceae bacterium]|nr:hypothetical protein [Defluviitaleaceae bacterium]
MELRIRVCEDKTNRSTKYEIIVPLSYTDEQILEVMTKWMEDIRATEAHDNAVALQTTTGEAEHKGDRPQGEANQSYVLK